jgi:RNA polymerase primary sigma factor
LSFVSDAPHIGTVSIGSSEELPKNRRQTTTLILASLTTREERIVRILFGIGMNSDQTLEEVGQQFSVARERIQQIEAKACGSSIIQTDQVCSEASSTAEISTFCGA